MAKRRKNVFRDKITFQNLGGTDDKPDAECMAVVMAFGGQHTKAIGRQLGFTPSEAQYRILKGGGKGIRKSFRNGETEEAKIAIRAIMRHVMKKHINTKVAPKFRPPQLPDHTPT